MRHPPAWPSVRNDEVAWDKFDSKAYCDDNYLALRDDDREIIEKVRDFMVASGVGPNGHGLDVGSGANLYPSLAMLPFCDRVDLWEFSIANVRWLRWQRWLGFGRRWDPFWQVYAMAPAYSCRSPRWEFFRKARVRRASVFDLPRRTFDIGTMFFVACSLSTDLDEFHNALDKFVGSLKPGAPFATAFMVKSDGYVVADRWFPAVPVEGDEVREYLKRLARVVNVDLIDSDSPLRPHVGMLLATGYA